MPGNTVKVDRSSVYGNPWTIKDTLASGLFDPAAVRQVTIENFRHWLGEGGTQTEKFPIYAELRWRRQTLLEALPLLRGKNLACWCHLCPKHRDAGRPLGIVCPDCDLCHADVLLEMANKGVSE